MQTPTFTKTETLKRLREAASEVRRIHHYPKNWRVEVGLRTVPVHKLTWEEAWDNHIAREDDLREFIPLSDFARYPDEQVMRQGYVAHLYFSSTGDYGELEDVRCVWLGTEVYPPAYIG